MRESLWILLAARIMLTQIQQDLMKFTKGHPEVPRRILPIAGHDVDPSGYLRMTMLRPLKYR